MDTQQRIEEIGRRLYANAGAEPLSLFHPSRWTGKALDWCMRCEGFKTQLFRFVDVFPVLATSGQFARHVEEYFGDDDGDTPALLQWGARTAGHSGAVGTTILRAVVRSNIEEMGRQFIVGENLAEAVKNLAGLRREGCGYVVSHLGEATVSEKEADEFLGGCRQLVATLHAEKMEINLAVKPSALYSQARPADLEGSVRGILARLRQLYADVVQCGGFLCLDMESHKYKNITLEVFRRLRAEPAFRAEARLGIALQVYMRDTERDLDELIAWARAERLPVSVRLVKGAYWDYENIIAEQNGWPSPVYSRKAETDLAFERCARKILEDRDLCHLACATHNLRSIAAVLATAEALNVPSDRYEFQLLYGMAEPVRKALQTQADTVRLYCPYGQLVPGMAYLVRRLLENTANESFLRQGFVEHADIGRLLEDPQHALAPEPGKARPPGPAFRNEPAADFTRADVRAAFSKAIADVRRQLGRTYPLFIAGREVSTDEFTETRNPANPVEVIGRVCHASRREVSTAIVAGREAFPAWRDMPVRARAGFLRKAAEIARRRIHELAAWQILEVGKQWDQAHADVAEAIDFLEFYAREMERLAEPRRVGAVPGELNQTLYEPRGVAVVIAPWNFPLAISCGMCAAALAAGNTVVYKPSDKSVVTGHMLLELFREAGLPAGVFNYVPGRGSEIGDFLVEHPDVALVAFTGSVEVGLRIIEKAGKLAPGQTHVKGVIAEMGGKNAIIVDDDADLDEAVPGVLQSAFGYQGQKCSACSRVIVLDAIHDAFVARLVEAARSMKLGPAEDPSNAMGPVEDAAQQQSCLEYIEIGKREGRLLYIGEVPGGGCYVPVTIIGGITPAHRLAQEEVFGPVLAVMRVKDFDEALAWANSARFALTGGVYSRSPRHLERARREFRVGNLYLNRGCTGALVERHPFGGFKLSGVGTKAGGTDYLLHFLHPRAISENTLRRGFAPADQL